MSKQLTISSYAVLALLDLQPWTGYDLAQQAGRSLRYAWPRSERLMYSEPKKLVKLGLATTHKETVGNRTRNVYEITDAGREALSGWSATKTQPPRFEAEALLRVLFADQGSLEEMRAVLDQFESDTGELHESVRELMATYLDGGHPFPERTHLSVLFATAQLEMFRAVEHWIEFARDEIAEWPSTSDLGMTERTKELVRLMVEDESVVDARRRES